MRKSRVCRGKTDIYTNASILRSSRKKKNAGLEGLPCERENIRSRRSM